MAIIAVSRLLLWPGPGSISGTICPDVIIPDTVMSAPQHWSRLLSVLNQIDAFQDGTTAWYCLTCFVKDNLLIVCLALGKC